MAEVKVFRLFQLCESVRRLLEKATGGQRFWVTCEIVRINERRGHRYLELVDMEGEEEIARMSGVLWGSTWNQLASKYSTDLSAILSNGKKVLLQCGIEYHELYGLKLQVYDVDASYTIGDLEARKRATLERLDKEGLRKKNSQLSLPLVIKRIGVVSSAQAAGYEDFINHLTLNTYNYGFSTRLFEASVQGTSAETEICRALSEAQDYNLDAIVMIRGGGSRLDLEVFNAYSIAVAIAQSRIPVITGIGHESDEVVADQVAHTRQKTPTAAAHFILARNMEYEAAMQWGFERIRKEAGLALRRERDHLHVSREKFMRKTQNRLLREAGNLRKDAERLKRSPLYFLLAQRHLVQRVVSDLAKGTRKLLVHREMEHSLVQEQIQAHAKSFIRQEGQGIKRKQQELKRLAAGTLRNEQKVLQQSATLIRANHPDTILKKGFSIIETEKGIVTRAADLQSGQDFTVRFYTFELKAKALKINLKQHGKKDG